MPESTALTETTPIVISPDDEHEWDQRDGETGLQYEKFRTYLLMPREDRSVSAAFRQWNEAHPPEEGPKQVGVQRTVTVFKDLAVEQNWRDRAASYDRLVDAKILERLANRRLQTLVEVADMGQALRKAATDALKSLKTTVKVESIDPQTKEVSYHVKSNLTPTEIAKLAQVGVELEQLAIGAPTERISFVGGQPGNGDTTADQMSSAKEELLRRIESVRKRRADANEMENEPVLNDDGSVADFTIDDFEVVVADTIADRFDLSDYVPVDHE